MMFRSASFACLETLRVCCGAQTSRFCRVIRRMQDVHCGSSVDRLNDAIGVGGQASMSPGKNEARRLHEYGERCEIPAAEAQTAIGRCLARVSCARCLTPSKQMTASEMLEAGRLSDHGA